MNWWVMAYRAPRTFKRRLPLRMVPLPDLLLSSDASLQHTSVPLSDVLVAQHLLLEQQTVLDQPFYVECLSALVFYHDSDFLSPRRLLWHAEKRQGHHRNGVVRNRVYQYCITL